jgi:hypothetical protein
MAQVRIVQVPIQGIQIGTIGATLNAQAVSPGIGIQLGKFNNTTGTFYRDPTNPSAGGAGQQIQVGTNISNRTLGYIVGTGTTAVTTIATQTLPGAGYFSIWNNGNVQQAGITIQVPNCTGQQAKAQGSISNQPLVNQPLVNQPLVNQPLVNQPLVNQPLVNQPLVQQPLLNQPLVNQPLANQPLVNQPLNNQPLVNQPLKNQPLVNQPLNNQPLVNQPAYNPNYYSGQTYYVYVPPNYNPPRYRPKDGNYYPAQYSPGYVYSVVQPANYYKGQPAVQQPFSQQPLVQQTLVQQPLVQQPLVQQPLVQQPLVQQPLVQQPLVQQPLAQQPLNNQPLNNQPLIQTPSTNQAATGVLYNGSLVNPGQIASQGFALYIPNIGTLTTQGGVLQGTGAGGGFQAPGTYIRTSSAAVNTQQGIVNFQGTTRN